MSKIFSLAASLWLALNLMTLSGYPAVWVDEILLSDAGMHLALGKGFVSTAWFNQPSSQFWAGYTPLYTFLLAGWLKLFGISSFVVRGFGLGLVAASLLMIWLFLKRLENDSLRWTIVLALAVCEPLAFLERAGRPDSLSLFLLCATALVFVEKTWRWRSAMLWILGALAVPVALQYAADILVLAVLAHLWFKPFTRRELLLWGTGAASGAGVLALIYAAHHVLRIFVEVTLVSKHSTVGRLLQNAFLGHGEAPFVFSDILTASLRDYATPVLIAGGVVVWLFAKRQNNLRACKLSSFGVACGVLIPLALQLLGKYPLYYAYMGAVPATVAIVAACGQLCGKARFANAAILALLLLGGAGRFWWKGWQQGSQTILGPSALVSSDDTVVADYPAYYQFIGKAQKVFAVDYAGGKLMPLYPARQAREVTKLIVRDSRFSEVAKKVGGRWQRTGEVTLIRHGMPNRFAIIDDDTRHPEAEPIGLYVRIAANQSGSTTTAVP